MVEDSFTRWLEDGKNARIQFGLPEDAPNEELIDKVLRRAIFKNEQTGEDNEQEEIVESFLMMNQVMTDTHAQILESSVDVVLKTEMLKSWLLIANGFEIILKEYNDEMETN